MASTIATYMETLPIACLRYLVPMSSPGTHITRPERWKCFAHSAGVRRVLITNVPPCGTPSAKSWDLPAASSMSSVTTGRMTSHPTSMGFALTRRNERMLAPRRAELKNGHSCTWVSGRLEKRAARL